ncbi:MAG: hypothetical protein ACK6BG_08680 [Cyanobacteriota bacterium]
MTKVSKFNRGLRWGFAGSSAAVLCLFAPHLIEYLSLRFTPPNPGPGLSGSVAPAKPVDRVIASLDATDLFSKLEKADQKWLPQEELLPDGSTRFLYKKRVGEPDLSVAELRSLINDPPSFETEREAINNLLETLRQAGVRVMLSPTLKKGAAAEWDHRQAVMRIQPDVTGKGSMDFLRVLNHESIHVAQSCRGGSLFARPKPLGVPVRNDDALSKTLNSPVYTDVSPDEKILELEAYSLQNDTHKADALVNRECNKSEITKLHQG